MAMSKSAAFFVWIIGAIFYAYQYILRVMPNVMMSDIMHEFNIDASLFGQFSGVYYIGYSLLHLPIGIMLDRFGPKKVMSLCIILTVIGTLPIIYTNHWIYPIIGRILVGIGSSAAILGTFKIIRMIFSEKQFTRMLSLAVTIGLIGAIYGGGPISMLSEVYGYKAVVQIIAAAGVILAIITYLIVPEMEATTHGTVFGDIKEVFTNYKVVFLCIFAGLMVGPLEGFVDVWGATFLNKIYGFNMKSSSYICSMMFIGMCFGGPFLSFIADKTGSYMGCIIGSGLIMMLSFILLIAQLLTQNTIIIAFILVGICSAYQIIAIYKASTFVHKSVVGLTNAVANMIIMIFGYGFHSVIGYIIHITGGIGNKEAFIYGVSIVPIALFVGVAGMSFIAYRTE